MPNTIINPTTAAMMTTKKAHMTAIFFISIL
jgi:hypothetical protein